MSGTITVFEWIMSGYIKLFRKITKWEWYGDINTTRLYVHLLLTANHKPLKWRGETIDRGQKLTSRAKLADETGLSEKQIRTCLNRLKGSNEVAIESTKKQTVITLCNYATYQSRDEQKGQAKGQQEGRERANDGPSNEQEGEEGKEEKNKGEFVFGDLPEVLADESFRSKWGEYEKYRRERKLSKLKPVSVKKQWAKLAAYGLAGALESIEQTIANGWQGLFEPKGTTTNRGKSKGDVRSEKGWI